MDKSNFPYSNYEPCMTHAYKQHVFHNSQTNDQKQRLKGASTYKRFLTDDISASLAFPIMPFYSHFLSWSLIMVTWKLTFRKLAVAKEVVNVSLSQSSLIVNILFLSIIVRRVMALHAHLNRSFQIYYLNWPTRNEDRFAEMGICIY